MFSILAMLYTIIVVVVECPWYFSNYMNNIYKEDDPKTHINWFSISAGFDKHLYFFLCASTFFFSTACHTGTFPVYKSLKNNIYRRISKVIQRSIILDVILYLLVGVSGFLTSPTNAPDLIINRNKIWETDYPMTISRLFMAFNAFFGVPANYVGLRIAAISLFCKDNEITWQRNWAITVPVLFITCFIGIVFNSIISYISLFGGFISVLLGYLFPAMVYIKNNDYPITHWKNISTMIITGALVGIGWTAGVLIILQDF